LGRGDRRPETRCGYHGGIKHGGEPCRNTVVPGTIRCRWHTGTDIITARSKGQVIVELRKWGLAEADPDIDTDRTMLQLVAQSAARVELYSYLLGEAYDAAARLGRLNGTAGGAAGAAVIADVLDTVADHDADAERQRIAEDIRRIFTTGGVGALIGWTYAATRDGDVYAVGEAIRGLAQLEGLERDRCMRFAKIAKDAGLAERQVRVAEQLAATLVEAVYSMLGELGLSRDDPRVRAVVAAKLRELAGGDGDGSVGSVNVVDGVIVDGGDGEG
jgi:hypothetical protein